MTRIPAPIDPKSIGIREVSHFQNRNLITMGGVAEFCIAKMAAQRMITKASQRKICMGFDLRSFSTILPKVWRDFKGYHKSLRVFYTLHPALLPFNSNATFDSFPVIVLLFFHLRDQVRQSENFRPGPSAREYQFHILGLAFHQSQEFRQRDIPYSTATLISSRITI